jgi:hypothetical protein
MRECLKTIDLLWTMNAKKKGRNLLAEICSLRKLYTVLSILFNKIFFCCEYQLCAVINYVKRTKCTDSKNFYVRLCEDLAFYISVPD